MDEAEEAQLVQAYLKDAPIYFLRYERDRWQNGIWMLYLGNAKDARTRRWLCHVPGNYGTSNVYLTDEARRLMELPKDALVTVER